MPTNKTHVITGSGVAAVLGAALHMPLLPIIFGATIGSGIPDIDCAGSSISRKLLLFRNKYVLQLTYGAIGLAAIIYGQMPLKLVGAYLILAAASGHRKFTHSLLGLLGFSGICIYALNTSSGMVRNMVLGLITGYAVHMIADSFSNHGIELFWPLYDRNFGLKVIKTNKVSEHIFLGVVVTLLIILLNHFIQQGGLIWF